MNRPRFKQIFAIILILMCVSCIFPVSFVRATGNNFNFSSYDNPASNAVANSTDKKVIGMGINIIRVVATGVAVIMLSYIGIKYMMAAPDQKAEFKKSATIYVLGAILIFAAGNILTIIVNFATSNIVTK